MKLLHTLLSPQGASARLSVMIFHRVLPEPDPLFPGDIDAARFDEICGWLARDFNVLRLDHAVGRLRERRLPARALAITFDDGYADNHDVALPILRRHGLSATFFVATGFLDGGRMWNDTVVEALRRTRHDAIDLGDVGLQGLNRMPTASVAERRSSIQRILDAAKYLEPPARHAAVDAVARAAGANLPDDLMMRSEQVAAMYGAGMAIGGHTVSHPILAVLPTDQARIEIDEGRRRLEELIQAPVTLFAYPNGRPREDYDEATVRIVREAGFAAAVTTAWGAARADTDPHQIPRFTPWDRTHARFAMRMAANLVRHPAALAA